MAAEVFLFLLKQLTYLENLLWNDYILRGGCWKKPEGGAQGQNRTPPVTS